VLFSKEAREQDTIVAHKLDLSGLCWQIFSLSNFVFCRATNIATSPINYHLAAQYLTGRECARMR
jgi:hypothetical protein